MEMENIIKKIANLQNELRDLKESLSDTAYWVDKAKEAGFIPMEGDWIAVELQPWKIMVRVYHKDYKGNNKYWINGEWFDTPFPKKIKYITALL